MTYGPRMVVDAFFGVSDVPRDAIGGWYVQGHNANNEYQDFVVSGAWTANALAQCDGWIDMIRIPLRIGDLLLGPLGHDR